VLARSVLIGLRRQRLFGAFFVVCDVLVASGVHQPDEHDDQSQSADDDDSEHDESSSCHDDPVPGAAAPKLPTAPARSATLDVGRDSAMV
jgi:hypothetical protein